jgi:dsDNA-specific endonuclease/ATPase MutS2
MQHPSFNIGDRVRLLDQEGEGVVCDVIGSQVVIDLEGMEMTFEAAELVVVKHDALVDQPIAKKDISAKDKEIRKQGQAKLKQLEDVTQAVYELDLHIDELLDHYSNMTNGEILQHQMRCCRQFVREAIDKRYHKIVLIHGVGEGVLRTEIHHYLDTLQRIEYHDAPYRTYGYGATEVIIHR